MLVILVLAALWPLLYALRCRWTPRGLSAPVALFAALAAGALAEGLVRGMESLLAAMPVWAVLSESTLGTRFFVVITAAVLGYVTLCRRDALPQRIRTEQTPVRLDKLLDRLHRGKASKAIENRDHHA